VGIAYFFESNTERDFFISADKRSLVVLQALFSL
jgi:hypothetical protein